MKDNKTKTYDVFIKGDRKKYLSKTGKKIEKYILPTENIDGKYNFKIASNISSAELRHLEKTLKKLVEENFFYDVQQKCINSKNE